MRYRAIEMGPVPNNFQSIFEYLSNQGVVDIRCVDFTKGIGGEQFFSRAEHTFDPSIFTEQEVAILERVSKVFEKTSTKKIIETSHQEEAWKLNHESRSLVSYHLAFGLSEV